MYPLYAVFFYSPLNIFQWIFFDFFYNGEHWSSIKIQTVKAEILFYKY